MTGSQSLQQGYSASGSPGGRDAIANGAFVCSSLEVNWIETVAPSALLTIVIVAFAFLGDGLRDAFDPQTKVA